jgi:CheY-like chemotaxis protein
MSVKGHAAAGISWKPLLICPNADLSQKLSTVWHTMPEAEPIVESPRYLEAPAVRDLAAGHGVTLCFLDVGSDQGRGLALVRALREIGIPVVVLDKANDPDLILSCLRQGAAEYLYPPFSVDQLRQALARLAKRAQAAITQARSGGEVYCLMRGKSGSGTTTLACNLAFQIQELNFQKVLLGDLDPLTGTIAFLLKLSSTTVSSMP